MGGSHRVGHGKIVLLIRNNFVKESEREIQTEAGGNKYRGRKINKGIEDVERGKDKESEIGKEIERKEREKEREKDYIKTREQSRVITAV